MSKNLKTEKEHKISDRGDRLRKIEIVYKEYLKNLENITVKVKESNTVSKAKFSTKIKGQGGHKGKVKNTKTDLNEYQKFVKKESKKEKYKDLDSKKRMEKIARAWKKFLKKSKVE
jgi:hypothetical protein